MEQFPDFSLISRDIFHSLVNPGFSALFSVLCTLLKDNSFLKKFLTRSTTRV